MTQSELDRRTLQEQALQSLRSRIINGDLLPGTRIVEADESARLGVSRGTLREALRQLEQQGLLIRDPRRVVYVRKLTSKEIIDVYGVRGALEVLAARSICEDADPELRLANSRALRQHAERLAEAQAVGSAVDEVAADLSFHEKLCELSGNTILLNQWRQMAALIRAMLTSGHRRLSAGWSHVPASIPEHHVQIVEALEAGDFERVSEILVTGFKRSSEFLASSS